MSRLATVFLLITLAACTDHSRHVKRIQARDVPAFHANTTDTSFMVWQDTAFWKGNRFSGILYDLSQNGDTLQKIPYREGIPEGLCKKWYPNGQLAEERLYIRGMKSGLHKGWWPNGKPRYEFTVYEDRYEGERKEWNEEGRLILKFHYKNGQECGRQQCWYNDGNVKANYTIVNGRRYGLLGTKNCTNVSDNISIP